MRRTFPFAFRWSYLQGEDNGVKEKLSGGGSIADGRTPVGVRLAWSFLHLSFICQVEYSADKGCNKGSQPSQVYIACSFISVIKYLLSANQIIKQVPITGDKV